MLISYPFLPEAQNEPDEDERLQYMLLRATRDRGLYPVSVGNRWHGGIHLEPEAPDEPVRAIADGEIVAYRVAATVETYPPTQTVADTSAAPQEPSTGGTDSHPEDRLHFDTSFILLKHTTESGENTPLVFYSLYMHLRSRAELTPAQNAQLPASLRNAEPSPNVVQAPANTRVWRKDVLGFTGTLYDQRRIHFEIFATNDDFDPAPPRRGFWRDHTTVAQGQHGSDDLFGDTHFIIPADRVFAARHPRAVAPHRITLPSVDAFYELDTGQAGQNTGRSLHVVVKLAEGRRTATTFRVLPNGRRERLGDPVVQPDYEYNFYQLASALYPDCPSAGYEYLRFGRVLSPNATTTRAENWQLIRYSETAMGYIDLALGSNNVSVLSDADLPLHWQRLDEGTAVNASDGICDVPTLLDLIGQPPDTNNDGRIDESEFIRHAGRDEIAETLRFLICKNPSEWDNRDLATRYQREGERGGASPA